MWRPSRWRVTRPFNIRRALLRAVDAFLEATPAAQANAQRLVSRCKKALQPYTLDDIVWGGIALRLSDPLHAQHLPALQRYHNLLATGSTELHRAYLNEDFRPDFTPLEREWYARLSEMLDFIDHLPFDHSEADTADYLRRAQEIAQLAAQSSAPAHLGEEVIYHLVLREVTAIATHVFIGHHHPAYGGRLLAESPYCMFSQPKGYGPEDPDVRESLAWARHALRSIAAASWLLIIWQVTPQNYNLSLH
jgi:hypothetical protein